MCIGLDEAGFSSQPIIIGSNWVFDEVGYWLQLFLILGQLSMRWSVVGGYWDGSGCCSEGRVIRSPLSSLLVGNVKWTHCCCAVRALGCAYAGGGAANGTMAMVALSVMVLHGCLLDVLECKSVLWSSCVTLFHFLGVCGFGCGM